MSAHRGKAWHHGPSRGLLFGLLVAAAMLPVGCGRKTEKPNPIRTLMEQRPGTIPGVWDREACEQACDDVDMGEPMRQPKNDDYVKCYKECE